MNLKFSYSLIYAKLITSNFKCTGIIFTVCVPFLDWKSECFKVFWWWVGCPTWNNCKWKVDNVICIAGCEIKKLANKFVAWAQQIGIKVRFCNNVHKHLSISEAAGNYFYLADNALTSTIIDISQHKTHITSILLN